MTQPWSGRRVLVVGCGFPQLSLLRVARELGLHVIGADLNPDAIGVAVCHEFHRVSTTDVGALSALIGESRATAITTSGSEAALKATVAVAERTGRLFYADSETIQRCQDKDDMRAAYVRAGVSVPPFASCTSFDAAREFVRVHGYPAVVKPSRGWGQRGVARVDDDGELEIAFSFAHAQSASAGLARVIIERWLDGKEYSVNAWIENGVFESYCVTERVTVPGKRPLGVMIAEVFPAGLSVTDETRVVDEARRGAQALGHVRGPCYSQVVFGPSGCFLFETAARMGGGFDADVTRLASGVDLYKRILGVALGDRSLEAAGVEGRKFGGAIAKFLIARPGIVRRIGGLEAARVVPGVDEAFVFVPVGGRVHPLTDSSKRAAYVLAHGENRQLATQAADIGLSCLDIDTLEPDATASMGGSR